MLHNAPSTSSDQNGFTTTKKKRRPAGTPDPDAEVVSLSPKTLLESDRYVCEICNQGFQRDQNLQMHRRRHKVPWQLLKREDQSGGGGGSGSKAKKVYVCPEPGCLHHDPRHALGDLVGIKKHFRRKHSTHKQWVCDKCSKAYAVQSDYKAHLKTCGTRGHSCDCGRVFSRVESFIEHQDACTVRRFNPELAPGSLQPAANSSRTASSSSASTEPNAIFPTPLPPPPPPPLAQQFPMANVMNNSPNDFFMCPDPSYDYHNHNLDLSIGLGPYSAPDDTSTLPPEPSAARLREYASEQLRLAAAEKAFAEEARQQARRQVEMAEVEFANAQRIRLQAQAELERAQVLKEQAFRKISSTLTQITCPACKLQFQPPPGSLQSCDESSLAMSYMSSATTEETEREFVNKFN